MKHRLPFEILYEDRDVIVIDKPAGLLTTHTRAKETHTAEELLNDYVRKGQRKSRNHVWLVHRLDRETSGVMMFAKTEEVSEYFRADWNALTEKTYIARVAGEFAEDHGIFESYLQEDADGYKVHSVPPPTPHNLRNPRNPLKLAHTEWCRLSVEEAAEKTRSACISPRQGIPSLGMRSMAANVRVDFIFMLYDSNFVIRTRENGWHLKVHAPLCYNTHSNFS